jgi:hypothetical protein
MEERLMPAPDGDKPSTHGESPLLDHPTLLAMVGVNPRPKRPIPVQAQEKKSMHGEIPLLELLTLLLTTGMIPQYHL